jgi:hypothetical protein
MMSGLVLVMRHGLSSIGPWHVGCRHSFWLTCWVWNKGMRVMTLVSSFSCHPLLISWVPVGFHSGSSSHHDSVNSLFWGDQCLHTTSIWVVQSCGARLLVTVFSWELRPLTHTA